MTPNTNPNTTTSTDSEADSDATADATGDTTDSPFTTPDNPAVSRRTKAPYGIEKVSVAQWMDLDPSVVHTVDTIELCEVPHYPSPTAAYDRIKTDYPDLDDPDCFFNPVPCSQFELHYFANDYANVPPRDDRPPRIHDSGDLTAMLHEAVADGDITDDLWIDDDGQPHLPDDTTDT